MVIAALRSVRGCVACSGSRDTAHQQSGARAHRGPALAAYCCAGQRAHGRTDDCAFYATVDGCLMGGRAPDLSERVLSAVAIVDAELIKILARTGQRHDARPDWNRGTGAQHQQRQ